MIFLKSIARDIRYLCPEGNAPKKLFQHKGYSICQKLIYHALLAIERTLSAEFAKFKVSTL